MYEGSNSTLAFLGGLALGAGLMYYLDPDRGPRRRALARDKAVRLTHETQEAVSAKARDIRNRAKGVLAETRSALTSSSEEGTRQMT